MAGFSLTLALLAMAAARHHLLEQPPPRVNPRPASCRTQGAKQGCSKHLCMPSRDNGMRANYSHARNLCTRCECSLCLICARMYNSWETKSGQLIESTTTRTQPPFSFAYMAVDKDMAKMMDQVHSAKFGHLGCRTVHSCMR